MRDPRLKPRKVEKIEKDVSPKGIKEENIKNALDSYESDYDEKNAYHLGKRYRDLVDSGKVQEALKFRARHKAIQDVFDRAAKDIQNRQN